MIEKYPYGVLLLRGNTLQKKCRENCSEIIFHRVQEEQNSILKGSRVWKGIKKRIGRIWKEIIWKIG